MSSNRMSQATNSPAQDTAGPDIAASKESPKVAIVKGVVAFALMAGLIVAAKTFT